MSSTLSSHPSSGSDDSHSAAVVWRANPFVLPGAWTQHTDPRGYTYYYNCTTRESSWEHPLDVEGAGEADLKEETHDSSPDVSVEQEQDAEDTYYVLPIAEV